MVASVRGSVTEHVLGHRTLTAAIGFLKDPSRWQRGYLAAITTSGMGRRRNREPADHVRRAGADVTAHTTWPVNGNSPLP